MNKQKLRDFVKYNPVFFSLYRGLGGCGLRTLSRLYPINEKKIFFISFGGRRYDDSPKAIYEEMLHRKEFFGFTFVWAFVGEAPDVPGNPIIVKTDSPAYYREIITSKYWITNASVERGLSFKRNGQICINTWHGTPLKRIGSDNNTEYATRIPGEHERFDLLCAQGEYDRRIFARVFRVSMDKILTCGLPRNDSLMRFSDSDVRAIRLKLGIPEDKKVLLYTPTFREYERDESNTPVVKPPIDYEKWESVLGDQWVMLVRAHYLLTEGMEFDRSEFLRDVSSYEPLNELYAIADAMISDYSSTLFDYAVLGRPMFCFAYDFDEYAEKRGIYTEALEGLPASIDRDQESLLRHIVEMDYEKKCDETREFRNRFLPNVGQASRVVVDEIVTRFGVGSSNGSR